MSRLRFPSQGDRAGDPPPAPPPMRVSSVGGASHPCGSSSAVSGSSESTEELLRQQDGRKDRHAAVEGAEAREVPPGISVDHLMPSPSGMPGGRPTYHRRTALRRHPLPLRRALLATQSRASRTGMLPRSDELGLDARHRRGERIILGFQAIPWQILVILHIVHSVPRSSFGVRISQAYMNRLTSGESKGTTGIAISIKY